VGRDRAFSNDGAPPADQREFRTEFGRLVDDAVSHSAEGRLRYRPITIRPAQ